MNAMLLTFGPNLKNHYQACFTLLTLLGSKPEFKVTVITDSPEFYRGYSGHVHVIPVTENTLRQWRGESQFFWRIKCKAVELMAREFPGEAMLYLDSDTFASNDLSALAAGLSSGQCYMHENEGLLSQLGSKTERAMWQTLEGSVHEGVEINAQTAMWNAGVIAIPGAALEAVSAHSLAICDSLCRTKAPTRLLEQFAFSLALNHHSPLLPASDWIGHYWGNKDDWNDAIANFFLHSKLFGRNLDEELGALAEFDFGAIALRRRKRSSRARLQRLIDKCMPEPELNFFK